MTTPDTIAFWEEEDDAVSERASEFFARRRCGPWDATDQIELDAWLAQSTAHYVAWVRIKGIAARADQLAAFDAFELKQAARADNGKPRLRRFVFPLLAAASLALIAPFALPFVLSLLQPADSIDSTQVGGRTLLNFADHTQIELNTDTVLRVRMTTAERTVWLEKGEAWFHVAHDAKHPFAVVAGGHRITDLGTEFLVRRIADDVDVTLLTGRASLSGQGTQSAMLRPGDEAIATPVSLSVAHKTPQEIADELAWRRGMLVFRNTPLSEVVREFNRYNTIKLAIADPSIADKTISANVKIDDYQSFLQMAEDVLKLRVEREGSVILISGGQRSEARKASHLRSHASAP